MTDGGRSRDYYRNVYKKEIINNSVINLAHWKTSNFSKDVSIINC